MVREASEGRRGLRCIKDNYMENSIFIWLSFHAFLLFPLQLDFSFLIAESKLGCSFFMCECSHSLQFINYSGFIWIKIWTKNYHEANWNISAISTSCSAILTQTCWAAWSKPFTWLKNPCPCSSNEGKQNLYHRCLKNFFILR